MSFDSALDRLRREVPECVAVGVVDLRSGTLLAGRDIRDEGQDGLENVAALTTGLFQGNGVSVIESLLQGSHSMGEAANPLCQEVVMVSSNRLHVFQRYPGNENLVVVSVCRGSVTVSSALLETRSRLRHLETAP